MSRPNLIAQYAEKPSLFFKGYFDELFQKYMDMRERAKADERELKEEFNCIKRELVAQGYERAENGAGREVFVDESVEQELAIEYRRRLDKLNESYIAQGVALINDELKQHLCQAMREASDEDKLRFILQVYAVDGGTALNLDGLDDQAFGEKMMFCVKVVNVLMNEALFWEHSVDQYDKKEALAKRLSEGDFCIEEGGLEHAEDEKMLQGLTDKMALLTEQSRKLRSEHELVLAGRVAATVADLKGARAEFVAARGERATWTVRRRHQARQKLQNRTAKAVSHCLGHEKDGSKNMVKDHRGVGRHIARVLVGVLQTVCLPYAVYRAHRYFSGKSRRYLGGIFRVDDRTTTERRVVNVKEFIEQPIEHEGRRFSERFTGGDRRNMSRIFDGALKTHREDADLAASETTAGRLPDGGVDSGRRRESETSLSRILRKAARRRREAATVTAEEKREHGGSIAAFSPR